MRAKLVVALAFAAVMGSGAAFAADQIISAPNPLDGLHGVDGKTYWETFAACYASASQASFALTKPSDQPQLMALNSIIASADDRAVARLMTDRGLSEEAAKDLLLDRATTIKPSTGFIEACNAVIRDHDRRFGAPK